MSRAFSTAARQLKKLDWSHNGTTMDVAWAKNSAEKGVDVAPGLADKVDSGVVQGNPHATPKKNDPFHSSIIFKNGDARVVSAHVYPNGTIRFSKDYAPVNVGRDPEAPEGDGPSESSQS